MTSLSENHLSLEQNFYNLPIEIHDILSDYLSPADLKSLSQTGSKTRPIYASRSFRHCTVYNGCHIFDTWKSRPISLDIFLRPDKYSWFINEKVRSVDIQVSKLVNYDPQFKRWTPEMYPMLRHVSFENEIPEDGFLRNINKTTTEDNNSSLTSSPSFPNMGYYTEYQEECPVPWELDEIKPKDSPLIFLSLVCHRQPAILNDINTDGIVELNLLLTTSAWSSKNQLPIMKNLKRFTFSPPPNFQHSRYCKVISQISQSPKLEYISTKHYITKPHKTTLQALEALEDISSTTLTTCKVRIDFSNLNIWPLYYWINNPGPIRATQYHIDMHPYHQRPAVCHLPQVTHLSIQNLSDFNILQYLVSAPALQELEISNSKLPFLPLIEYNTPSSTIDTTKLTGLNILATSGLDYVGFVRHLPNFPQLKYLSLITSPDFEINFVEAIEENFDLYNIISSFLKCFQKMLIAKSKTDDQHQLPIPLEDLISYSYSVQDELNSTNATGGAMNKNDGLQKYQQCCQKILDLYASIFFELYCQFFEFSDNYDHKLDSSKLCSILANPFDNLLYEENGTSTIIGMFSLAEYISQSISNRTMPMLEYLCLYANELLCDSPSFYNLVVNGGSISKQSNLNQISFYNYYYHNYYSNNRKKKNSYGYGKMAESSSASSYSTNNNNGRNNMELCSLDEDLCNGLKKRSTLGTKMSTFIKKSPFDSSFFKPVYEIIGNEGPHFLNVNELRTSRSRSKSDTCSNIASPITTFDYDHHYRQTNINRKGKGTTTNRQDDNNNDISYEKYFRQFITEHLNNEIECSLQDTLQQQQIQQQQQQLQQQENPFINYPDDSFTIENQLKDLHLSTLPDSMFASSLYRQSLETEAGANLGHFSTPMANYLDNDDDTSLSFFQALSRDSTTSFSSLSMTTASSSATVAADNASCSSYTSSVSPANFYNSQMMYNSCKDHQQHPCSLCNLYELSFKDFKGWGI